MYVQSYFTVLGLLTHGCWIIGTTTPGNDAAIKDSRFYLNDLSCISDLKNHHAKWAIADHTALRQTLLQGQHAVLQSLDFIFQGLFKIRTAPGGRGFDEIYHAAYLMLICHAA